MPIRAVVYVSEASPVVAGCGAGTGNTKLDALIDDAARFNRDAGVSGVLLFDGERFLQYMEGPQDGLSVAFSRVLGSTSHSSFVEMQRGRVGQRRLPFWPMRWLPVPPDQLKALALADWTGFAQRGDADPLNPSAMDLLVGLVEPYALAA